ncbi:MAG: amino acid adenylation domain-containing protein [Porcipelethomonas sp.]
MNLTKPQQLIYEMEKFSGGAISVICGSMLLKGSRNPQEIITAINELYNINDALRIKISESNGNVQQTVCEYAEQVFEILNFNSKDELDAYAENYATEPLDLYGSLCEFKVVILPEKYGCLVKLHHIIGDAWTLTLFGTQLNFILNGEAVQTYSYADYIENEKKYLDGKRYEKDRAFFLEQFKKCDEPTLLNEKNVDSLKSVRKTFVIEKVNAEAIRKYCSDNESSPFMLFMSALAVYMNRIKMNREKFYIGTAVLNRSGTKERNTAGMFINTVPLLIELDNTKSFSENISALEDSVMSVFRHQKFNYSDILKSIRQEYNFTEKLYDVMLSYQNAVITGNEIESTWYHSGMQSESLQIHIDDRDNENIYRIHYDYQTDKFSGDDIFAMHSHICKLLFDAINNSNKKIYELEMLSDAEYQKVIFDFNDTAVDYPRDKCIHELFSEQAAKSPDKVALVFEEKKFTYRQLDEMSNSLAHYLHEEKGIKPNDIVPIIAKRSWHIIVAMLGILKAGGAYMPVDPTYPMDRILFMIEETKSEIALTFGYEGKLEIDTVSLENFDYSSNIKSIENLNTSSDLCYLIFTSGSTGTPKAVMISHLNVSNYTNDNEINVVHRIIKKSYKSILSVTNIVFDIFVTESILSLLNGITIYFTNDEEILLQEKLAILIHNNDIDVMQTTPTKMRGYMLDKNNLNYLKKLKTVILGGEALPTDLYEELSRCTEAEIYNIYGPAETTVWSTNSYVENIDITIGKPIANTQIYILDKNRKPLPIGVAGELCISGDGVGKGYLNRPELTAEKFILNPFYDEKSNPTAGKIMYCTGDLARWRADGEIEYLGRIDTQVKIRGLRIELGEIESVMSTFDGINMTAVTDKRDESNRQYLVGYYTAEREIDEKELRQHLSAKLPKYMLPNYFVHLDEMPMTASGKTDRKSLPLPDFTQSKNEYTTPETETEKKAAAIWSELLNIENVGKTDDFYDLGGDSLLAISLLNHLENTFGVEISMKDILENPVLENLAKCIDNAGKKVQKIAVTGADRYVLLPQQKAIYAVCSKNPQTLTYNMPARIALDNSIDREKLKDCFREVVNAHRSLKTYIKAENNEIYGIYDSAAELCFEEYSDKDISGFIRPFDLEKAPLIHIGFTETAMLFDMHHIIADGESLNIILRDLAKLYFGENIFVNDVQYADYAEYFHNSDFSAHKAYFKEMLKCDFEPTVLPEKKHASESAGVSKIYQLNGYTFAMGRKYARENGLTETMLFLGVYGILLSKYTAKSEVLSSIILTNRTHRETQDIVGMFVNTLPVMMKASGTVSEYFENVKQLVLNLFEYQELPFSEAAEAVGMMDKSVVNTSFVYQADGEKKLYVGNTKLSPEFIDTHTSKFDLTFELTPNESGCMLRIEYNSGKYEEELIDRLFAAYVRIISQLDKENISDISVLSEEEYQKVIFDFNDTAVDYPKDKCIHELFSEQAAKTPDKIALVFEDKKFTYKQLDEMSNSLAHYLREEKGIKPNDIVPIISKRSWQVIVAMLGILKAGGAYMPVDPSYPIDRIEYMISEVNATLALTCGFIEKISVSTLELEYFDYNINYAIIPNANVSSNKCYVMFTSGTTGKPKATVVTHQNLSNFINNNDNNMYQFNMLRTCSTTLALTNYTFDISVFEIYLSLLNGLTVVISNDKENLSASLLAKLIEENHVDVIHSTPTKIAMLLENADFKKAAQNLKMLMAGAETFTEDFSNKIREYTNAVVYNGYGPTETTIGVSFKRINGSPYAVHELFRKQATQTPDRIALVFEGKQFTYRQLDEMSNSLAHYLHEEKGIKPNDIVPIISKRSWHVIVAMLGILKAGGAYTLIDSNYPAERIEYLVELCNSEIVLTCGCEYTNGVRLESFDYTHNVNPIANCNKTTDLFCAIHTSGSTGTPKLTTLTHANISHYIKYSKYFFKDTEQTISTTIITFDAFIQETIVALCNDTTVVLCTDNEMTNQNSFETIIRQYNNSFLFQTPTKLLSYIRNSRDKEFIKHISCFVIGGEIFPDELFNLISEYNSDCKIYNIYGPTETTICATTDDVIDEIDITIGKPIANTQIYILDRNRNPLPIGVSGELCISGDGVGKGYLNRPELTAEKFIPNPFIEGKTMYCTGDLARWREDGELEYLGRIDTQVKIRGLRIELGEIESVMSSFGGIRLTAVTDKRDENNRQYLVGYYTAEREIDEKALRQHLSAKLPKYMVPNYFVHLSEMPMTASGKTDRKNLPLPDFTQAKNEYTAPKTETEIRLCKLLEKLLGIEQVGVTDDFFELGGDSLKAIEYIAKAHNLGIEIALQNIFDYPTVRELCDFLNNGAEKIARYTVSDFQKYQEILNRNVIDDNFVPQKKSLGNVLLTGATGFLGAHILDNLMRNEADKIYCLVRSNSEDDRRGRIKETLQYYFGNKYDDEMGRRIIPVVGDITISDLSDEIPYDVQTVIHTAATVKHYGSYQYFYDVNVQGTKNVVNFAKRVNAKMIHISTLSVSGNSLADEFSIYRSKEEKNFYETSLFIGQPLENVYIRSKFEAEMEVLNAILEGLDAKIVRVGNLTNRLSDSKFQPNYESNAFLTRFKAAVELGMFPEHLLPLYAEFSPIDQTADGVVKIAQYADKQCVFHLNSNRPIYFTRLLKVFRQLDIKMELVSGEMFNNVLQQIARDSKTEYIYEAFQNDMDENGQLVYDTNIHIINDFTDWFMKKVGFEWAQIDFEYVKGYVEYFRNIGYLEV